ncbi:P-II family nitrogen regulator [Candidatus Magnetaquicoccus inordinatus]|uniref:P-II family nitrogen regulator n=1 Tax=Candidatus Magnetaquicoccus inordinatus TaxID=2496818 RepID=UPI00102BE550|nr:P-II family nitrogen regulator [Candidatus Magnetaquicoccus inordinatus]
MGWKLVVVTVRPQMTERIIAAARGAGALGATVIPARGTVPPEKRPFFGLALDNQRDLILFLLDEARVAAVTRTIHLDGDLDTPGTGMLFVLDVEQAMGLREQLLAVETEIREQYN